MAEQTKMAPRTGFPLSTVNRVEMREVDAGVRVVNNTGAGAGAGVGSGSDVVGSSDMYDQNGNIRLIPMPSADPKDPLNLPNWRKFTAIAVLCFFGSLALSAEISIGALFPIFLLEYAGVDPTTIRNIDFVAASGGSGASLNPLAVIPAGVAPPPLQEIALLSTIPLITNGIASYLLVPLSIAVGRRPVLLLTAVLAWAGALWAGLSSSLRSHIIARAVMGLGAGSVEALIPLIVQDIVFIHQRAKAQSAIITSQGIIMIALGIAAPYVAANHSWRYLYYAAFAGGVVAWLLLVFLMPETRWTRSREMLAGRSPEQLPPGRNRPNLDPDRYGGRTLWTNVGVFHFGFEWKNAALSMIDTVRTTLFPAVVWSILANSIFLITNTATGQLTSFALLAQGWQFQWTGLSIIPFVIATGAAFIFSGPVADRVLSAIVRRNKGVREPEFNLANMLLPMLCGVAGCFVYGRAAQANLHWAVLLLGSFFISFGFLCVLINVNVFVVESYPQWAGPVLVNVSSLRIIVAFFLASLATTWVVERGVMATFAIYAECMIAITAAIPILWFFGRKIRVWTAGKVHTGGAAPAPRGADGV